MSRLIRLLKSARNSIYENVYPSRININNRNTIFSFSFDDVPISAMRVGARILESHSAPGTFYVAMGMSDEKWSQKTEQGVKWISSLI